MSVRREGDIESLLAEALEVKYQALQRVAKGALVVDPGLVQDLVSARRRDNRLAVLTAREQEVPALAVAGRSNADIAHRLWVTEGTGESTCEAP